MIDWLNYHHLHYFWTVAREGSITRAAERLHLAQPTLSNQLKKLEKSIGAKLFERRGRELVLTETGMLVQRYADEIFTIGRELMDTLNGFKPDEKMRLLVGVPDVLPKLVVYRLLKPAMDMDEEVQIVCREGKNDDLLADLASHRLDLVLSDAPLPPSANVRAYNHVLGECGVTVFGTKKLRQDLRKGFPQSMNGAPMLLPTQNTVLRRDFEQWCDHHSIRPYVVHEFEDSAILKVFGQAGTGIFMAPTAVEAEVRKQYSVEVVGRIDGIRERFYAISVERRIRHPAVLAISDSARAELFSTDE
ncbi:MAG: transcriptional activator NhaR [Aureliella sp.]